MNAAPTDAPRLSEWEDAHDRVVIGEANTDGAWIAVEPEATVDVESLQ